MSFRRSLTLRSRPRRAEKSFLCIFRWSVRSLISAVRIAIWTSGETVAAAWFRTFSVIFSFALRSSIDSDVHAIGPSILPLEMGGNQARGAVNNTNKTYHMVRFRSIACGRKGDAVGFEGSLQGVKNHAKGRVFPDVR